MNNNSDIQMQSILNVSSSVSSGFTVFKVQIYSLDLIYSWEFYSLDFVANVDFFPLIFQIECYWYEEMQFIFVFWHYWITVFARVLFYRGFWLLQAVINLLYNVNVSFSSLIILSSTCCDWTWWDPTSLTSKSLRKCFPFSTSSY